MTCTMGPEMHGNINVSCTVTVSFGDCGKLGSAVIGRNFGEVTNYIDR